MEQKKVIRDFKVLTEQISPDNVAVMAELIAMRETKALIGYYTVTTSSKAWRYSYATTSESIWTTSCISPKKASR